MDAGSSGNFAAQLRQQFDLPRRFRPLREIVRFLFEGEADLVGIGRKILRLGVRQDA